MKSLKYWVAATALTALAAGAQAQVSGSVGGGGGSFLSLSAAGLGDGTATLSGGAIYSVDETFASMPSGSVFGGNFLAAGRTAGAPATLTFAGLGVDYVSFLWGSPDTYNVLTVTTTGGVTTTFDTTSLGFAVSDGDQTFSNYVQFVSTGGAKIVSLTFDNLPNNDAFETANFSVTAVPEPESYALLLAGLVAVGFVARRRFS